MKPEMKNEKCGPHNYGKKHPTLHVIQVTEKKTGKVG